MKIQKEKNFFLGHPVMFYLYLFAFFTWYYLCTEPCCTVIAADQNNGVGKRGGHPSHVRTSCHTVIAFDKGDHCEGLLLLAPQSGAHIITPHWEIGTIPIIFSEKKTFAGQ